MRSSHWKGVDEVPITGESLLGGATWIGPRLREKELIQAGAVDDNDDKILIWLETRVQPSSV